MSTPADLFKEDLREAADRVDRALTRAYANPISIGLSEEEKRKLINAHVVLGLLARR